MKGLWSILRRYVRPYRGYLGGSVLLNILSAVFNIFSFSLLIPILKILFNVGEVHYEFIPWDSAETSLWNTFTNNLYWAVSGSIESIGASRVLLLLCLILCFFTLLKTACYFGSAAVMVPIRTGIVRDLRRELYSKILSLPVGYFSRERKGDIIARMSGDVQEVETSIAGSLDMLVKNPILIFFYVGTLLVVSWQLTLFMLLFAPLVIWLMGLLGRRLRRKSSAVQALWSDTMSQVEETLGGLRVIKAFLGEKAMGRRFAAVTEDYRKGSARVATRQALAHPVSEFLGTVMIAVVLWFGGTLILGGSSVIDAPTFIFYLVIMYSVIQPIKDFSKSAYGIPKGMASMDRIDAVLNAQSNIADPASPAGVPVLTKGIELKDVYFAYEDGAPVLSGINLSIPKGSTLALVGPSGAGKSTLADLLPRFYDVRSGAVLIDGTDVRDLRVRDLRSLFGIVNQDPFLFNDTIYNNIAFGCDDATPEAVEAAARVAGAHGFICEKPQGYQTIVGDRGVLLSGGERQRLSIARAILKNPPILILDEATASLDSESEREVQAALSTLMKDRTTVAIAHRLSTVRDAAQIAVVEGGRIVELGTHEQLLALGGLYKKLYDMQSL